ncbi:MAG: hypothetical protein ACR9NN_23500 [Nostochopsis sp.]
MSRVIKRDRYLLVIPLLLLPGDKNTGSTLNLKHNHELCDRILILSFKSSC